MTCAQCGAALPEGATFCPECGRPVAGRSAPPSPPADRSAADATDLPTTRINPYAPATPAGGYPAQGRGPYPPPNAGGYPGTPAQGYPLPANPGGYPPPPGPGYGPPANPGGYPPPPGQGYAPSTLPGGYPAGAYPPPGLPALTPPGGYSTPAYPAGGWSSVPPTPGPYGPAPGQGYPYGYNYFAPGTLPPRQGNPALLWIGGGLILLGFLGVVCFALIAVVAAQDPSQGLDQIQQTQLGAVVCGVGILLLCAIPGVVLLFLGRRR